MGELYNWMIQAKQRNPQASMHILQQFEPKLKQCLYRTTYQERDDLRQELQIKILKATEQFDTQSVPGFIEYLQQSKAQITNKEQDQDQSLEKV